MKQDFFSEIKKLFLGAPVSALIILVVGLMITPKAAMSSETGDVCIGHFQPGAVCTANDVRIHVLNPVSVIKDCNQAPDIGWAEMVFEILVGAEGSPDRYDIGIFMALDGGSAISGHSCFHDYLEPPLSLTPVYGDHNVDGFADIYNGPWLSSDSDLCGDMASNTQVIRTLVPLRFRCVDTNGDGKVDIAACASWDNQGADNCTGLSDVFPSTKSKCSCEVIDTDIIITVPSISVDKSPATQAVVSGQNATFTITASNSGNVPLSNITINDPLCDTLTGPAGDVNSNSILETTETWTYSCTVNNVTGDFTNNVTVTGTPPSGPDVSDNASADVFVNAPVISVLKTPSTQTLASGGTATFTITVTNSGSVQLSTIAVNDPLCDTLTGPTGNGGTADLDIGETWTYTCTVSNVTNAFINNVTVTGMTPAGGQVSDGDEAEVLIQARPVTAVPTMTEWGMIIFMALAGFASVYYLRRERKQG